MHLSGLAIAVIACSGIAISAFQIDGSYRKDYFLPYDVYPEYNQPDPVHGGRVHLVATLPNLKSPLSSVKINGQELLNLPTSNFTLDYFDWGKAWYYEPTQQFHAAFHSRNDQWFNAKNFTVDITDASNQKASGWYAAVIPRVILTWITPLDDQGSQWIVHITNNGSETTSIDSILFNGVTPASVSTTFPRTLTPSQRLVVLFNTTSASTRGTPFTIRVGFDGTFVAYGARTPEARFPIEVWPRSSDCPIPTVNDDHYSHLQSHGIDTVFYAAGDFQANCNMSLAQVANAISTSHPEFYFWTDTSGLNGLQPAALDHISAILLADENDGNMDANLRETLAAALHIATNYPSILTYQGGKTNRHNGAYAGICDIQGLDFYIAGCAPTIIPVTVTLPLQGSYAYIHNARNNHMPLPSMLYSQLFGSWDVEPHANEIIVELASVLLAGAKGMTLFQSVEEYFSKQSADWNGGILTAMRSITHPQVKEVLRTGDIDALPFVSSDQGDPIKNITSLTQVIRNHDHMLVIVTSFNAQGYNNLLCHVYASSHWKFEDHTVSNIEITLTDNVSLTPSQLQQAVEVVNGTFVAVQNADFAIHPGAVTLSNVQLQADMPLRLFLIPYTLV
eukprot:m.79844 g.79844  ORF g.79844 m.79844 type:complete len:620 (-) comp14183_c1_seq2:174-2033(-)